MHATVHVLDLVLKTALCLYMENHRDDPLPTPEEVLVCTPSTTAEEVELNSNSFTWFKLSGTSV